jgi:hypothetical protein
LGLFYNLGARLSLPAKLGGRRGLNIFFSVIAVVSVVLSVVLYLSIPGLEDAFIDEDALIENLTATLFLGSGILAGLLFRHKLRHNRSQLMIPILSIWAFFEEISFGERIFDLEMPYLGGEKFDGLHDLFFLLYESLRIRGALPWTLTGFTLLLFGIWAAFPGFRNRIQNIFKAVMDTPPFTFLAISVGFISVSFVLDLEFLDYRTGYFLEELTELIGGLALGFAALSLGWIEHDDV